MCAKLNFRFTEISEEIALKVCSGETLGSTKTGDGISFKVSVLSCNATKGDGKSLVLSLFSFLRILTAWNFSKNAPQSQFLMPLTNI